MRMVCTLRHPGGATCEEDRREVFLLRQRQIAFRPRQQFVNCDAACAKLDYMRDAKPRRHSTHALRRPGIANHHARFDIAHQRFEFGIGVERIERGDLRARRHAGHQANGRFEAIGHHKGDTLAGCAKLAELPRQRADDLSIFGIGKLTVEADEARRVGMKLRSLGQRVNDGWIIRVIGRQVRLHRRSPGRIDTQPVRGRNINC